MASTTAQLNEKLLEDILAIYNQAEQDVNKAVAKRLAKGITEKGWAETKQTSVQGFIQEVKAILGNNYKLAQNKAAQGILKAFLGGVNDVELEAGKTKTIMDKLFIPDSIQQLVLTQNDLLNDMNAKVLRGVDDKYRQLQAEASSMVLAGTDTRLDATKRLLNKFSNAGITSFVDKAGRNWNMQSYAEMCVRTNTAHAALQGRIQKQLDLGQDLMKVSSIGTTCPICARWQGVVISITGKSMGFKTLDDARSDGLFHPNCKHTLLMYDEELDGEAKTELNEEGSQYNVAKGADSVERYNLTQQQRANERTIRKLKRQYELALTPQDKANALKKVREAQAKQLQFCDINNLERKYYREGLTKSQVSKMVGPELSKKEKEQEALLKSVLGINPKKEFYMKHNLQFFSEASAIPEYKKFLKDEIRI